MKGLLFINVGTPDAPEPGPVRRYLREFLGDPRVLDIHPVGRFLLLNLFILPFRPRQSAEAYKKIWTEEGSPLLVLGRRFADKVAGLLGDDWKVELAMRYGNPSLAGALESFRQAGVDRIVLFPMYPQYAASSTGTSVERIVELVSGRWNVPSFATVPAFYDHPAFLAAFAQVGREALAAAGAEHVLFSFHGLPERHIRKSDETGDHCLEAATCCDAITFANRNCYRAQCFATARGLARELGLGPEGYTVCFQSRLGRTPWISPYTDVVIPELARRGVKRLAVFCPAFVTDCLETLEEIGIRAVEQFREHGGESLALVPSLNDHPAWVEAAARLVRETSAW